MDVRRHPDGQQVAVRAPAGQEGPDGQQWLAISFPDAPGADVGHYRAELLHDADVADWSPLTEG